MKNKAIYLDHSATTPVDPAVLKVMRPYFTKKFGNPSSLHAFGQIASAAVEKSRRQIAKLLRCQAEEIIFTSGATEADNLAIFGLVNNLSRRSHGPLHLITSSIEHPAVLEPLNQLEKQGVEVTYLPVKANGTVDPALFEKSIKDNTVFVSIMYVNSEVGSVQPIAAISRIIEKVNQSRASRGNKQKIYFHTDAVQALNYFNCETPSLGVDLLSLSGHKIYGPKGIGALFVKSGTPIDGVQLGGHHERNLRSGTLNVPGIVGLGEAAEICLKHREKNNRRIIKLRNAFVADLKRKVDNIVINTDLKNASPSHANVSFVGAEGEAILIALDLAGVAVSTGSACASASLKASPVLLAMGIKEEVAHSTIRFTFGKNNSASEVKSVLAILPKIVSRFRKMAPEI